MKYNIKFKPRAVKDFEALPSRIQASVLTKIEEMTDNLSGDVKRLTDSTPEYRLRLESTGYYLKLKEAQSLSIEFGIAGRRTDKWRLKPWLP